MTDREKLLDRIRKLLNMTVERGCTEDEADNALRMAAGLATKLGIELDSIRPAGEAKPKIKEKASYKKMKIHEALCAQAAAVLYGVQCVATNYGKHGFYYTGRESNIELAEETMLWLIRQVELLYKEALPKGLTKTERHEFRQSFKDACARKVYERAQRMMYEMQYNEQAAQEATGSTALVVKGYFKKLRDEIRDFYSPTQEQQERWKREEEKHQQWRRDNPEEAARMDAEQEAQRKKWAKEEERRARKRKGTGHTGRSEKVGSGTSQGRQAGERVQLRKEIE